MPQQTLMPRWSDSSLNALEPTTPIGFSPTRVGSHFEFGYTKAMLSLPIPFTASSFDFFLPFPGLPGWARVLLVLAAAGMLALLLVLLYRFEMRAIPRWVARTLLGLRLATVAAVFLTLSFDPTLKTTTYREVPSRVLVAIDRSDSMRVTDPHRPDREKQEIAHALRMEGNWLAAHDATTRLQQVVRILSSNGLDLYGEIQKKHAIELLAFDQIPAAISPDPDKWNASLRADRKLEPGANGTIETLTDLKLPFARASESAADTSTSKLIGLVLFTDGRHNWGDSPLPRAQELAGLQVPVHIVVMAPVQSPPDIAVVSAQAQTATVFKGSTVPVEASVRVTGWPAGPIKVSMTVPPDEKGNKREPVVEMIDHTGEDQTYPLALRAKLDAPGPQSMTVTAESAIKKDNFPSNNSRTVRVNVVKDRARVMLIDGEARWEFHYLHTCLGRDENMDVRSIVFQQPRITKATDDELKKFGIPALKLPSDPDELNRYDCVVLGDVDPAMLSRADRERLEKFVGEDSGTLVIVAGKRFMPGSFRDDTDPLRKLLPIKNSQVLSAADGFRLTLAADGQRSWFLQLGDTSALSRWIWENLPRHFWVMAGDAKDGAEVLADVAGKAVIARQNYGFGRVLYVGIDSTWRWRYKVGDKYHHKFWGQVAQWAASDRLLPAQNAAGTIRFGTREPAFRMGQDVEVIARGTEAVTKLQPNTLKGARIIKLPANEKEVEKLVSLVPLSQPENRARDLTGKIRELAPGKYAVELVIDDWVNSLQETPTPRSAFEVLPPDNEELTELSADMPLLEEIAKSTGGKVYTPDKVNELLEKLSAQVAKVESASRHPARKSWITLVVVLGLLAAEWGLRKWAGLP
jgi:hypothetical protein